MRFLFACSLAALAFTAPALALDVPRPSPSAKAVQTVGLTEISVEYSSPAVHGRAIWGALEPWGEVWRAGANATTKITFSRDVTIGSTKVAAGSYAFFVIPNQSGPWTVIINTDYQQGGAFKYNKALDVVRVDVTPNPIPNRERLAYLFSDFTDDGGTLNLEWEKVQVALPFKVDTAAQVETDLKNLEDNAWQPYNAAANFERTRQQFDLGLTDVEKSIKLKETWQNLWTKAQLEAAKGNYKSASSTAEKARALGKDAPKNFQDDSAKALAEWKSKK